VLLGRTPDVVTKVRVLTLSQQFWWRFKAPWVLCLVDQLLIYVLSKLPQVFASQHVLISQDAQTFVSISKIGPNLVYVPSFIPSSFPYYLPSFLLYSCIPSFLPPFLPSSHSSFLPSFLHFYLPSFMSSFFPSFLPSNLPSFIPSFLPSSHPSFLPFYLPSFMSLFFPSFLPTFFHSFIPSFILSFMNIFFRIWRLSVYLCPNTDTSINKSLYQLLLSPRTHS
jgi:hypothetical protein